MAEGLRYSNVGGARRTWEGFTLPRLFMAECESVIVLYLSFRIWLMCNVYSTSVQQLSIGRRDCVPLHASVKIFDNVMT